MRLSVFFVPLCILAFVTAPCSARDADGWIGHYDPISATCAKMPLTLVPSHLSFGDCKAVGFTDSSNDEGFAATIDDHAAYALAGKILTLTPDGDANNLAIFDSEKAREAKRPSLVCAYSK